MFGYYTTGNYSVSQFFFFVSDLLLLACHEGYPGYHVTNLLFEDRLSRKRRWVEFIVIPLYSPLLLIMEGVANYALELAFPVDERIAFSHDCLYPLAGLDPALAKSAVPIFEAIDRPVRREIPKLYDLLLLRPGSCEASDRRAGRRGSGKTVAGVRAPAVPSPASIRPALSHKFIHLGTPFCESDIRATIG